MERSFLINSAAIETISALRKKQAAFVRAAFLRIEAFAAVDVTTWKPGSVFSRAVSKKTFWESSCFKGASEARLLVLAAAASMCRCWFGWQEPFFVFSYDINCCSRREHLFTSSSSCAKIKAQALHFKWPSFGLWYQADIKLTKLGLFPMIVNCMKPNVTSKIDCIYAVKKCNFHISGSGSFWPRWPRPREIQSWIKMETFWFRNHQRQQWNQHRLRLPDLVRI